MTTMNLHQASGRHHHHHARINRFPLLLYSVLQDSLTDPELAEIISWEESGTAFRIHDQKSCVEKVFPRYFPKMKSYRSLRRQLNLYGILIQNHPSRKFSFHIMSPSAKSGVAGGASGEPLRLSSGVYSHPLLKQDRPDLAARIPRMVPQPSRSPSGSSAFFFHETTASGTSSTSTSSTISPDGAMLHTVRSDPESPNTADYYLFSTSSSTTTSTPSSRAMVSPETKSISTLPPNIMLALDAEPATKSFFSLMQHPDSMIHSNKNRNTVMIHPIIAANHSTTDDGTRTWIEDSWSQQVLSIPSLIGLQHQEHLLDSSTVRHYEDIRLEIIRTFL